MEKNDSMDLKRKIEEYRHGHLAADNPALLDDEHLLNEMKHQWQSAPEELGKSLRNQKAEMWNRITQHLQMRRIQQKLTLYRRFSVAASILVVLFAGYSVFMTGKSSETVVHMLSTGNQNKTTVMLDDGTRVTLGPNSSLRYPDRFEGSKRKVALDGQAFFDVAADAARPFTIDVDEVSVTALGTSFEIFSPTDKKYVEAILQTGKIRVDYPSGNASGTRNSQIILPDHKLVFDRTTGQAAVVTTDAVKYSEWMSGSGQNFKSENLQFIVPRLERWYGVTIRFSAELYDRDDRFTFKITDESLDHILELMQKSSDIRWRKDDTGDRYTLF